MMNISRHHQCKSIMCGSSLHSFFGEFIGTFILVFFGCASISVSILFGAHSGLFQIAMVWGIGIAIAIYVTRHLSCAHLNPAVTLAMVISKRMSINEMPIYMCAQFLGAFCSAALIYIIFNDSIMQFENMHHIVRGKAESIKTAMMFGEFYPNPGIIDKFTLSTFQAFLVEAVGSFILVFVIFCLTECCNVGKPDDGITPLFIGLTVTILISVTAPLTQTGLNPARDLSPRIFAYFAGWKGAAFPDQGLGFLIVYVIGPFTGGTVASLFFTLVVEPLMSAKKREEEINRFEIENVSKNNLVLEETIIE